MSASKRDKIRSATIGQAVKFKSEVVTYNGVDVEIRQPSHKSRKEILAKATGEDGKFDTLSFITYAIIFNTYVPGTEELVFEESDYDAMVAKPTGGFVDLFGKKAADLLNVEADIDNKSTGA